MTQQSAFLIKSLDKIGAPLAAAVEVVSMRSRGDMEAPAREVEDAKIMAQLLGQTVQVSLSLGGTLIQASDEADADALRLAVAAMVAPLIANYYEHHGQVPDEAGLSRITKSLEASVAFAENFNPASDQGARLSMLGKEALILDNTQVDITVLDALSPVINAIGRFSFGHSETKLLQEIRDKLSAKAAGIAGDLGQAGDKLSEMMILKSLGKIYASCHVAQMEALSKQAPSDDAARSELSMEPVWADFDRALSMVNVSLGLGIQGAVDVPEPVNVAPQTSQAAVQSAPEAAPQITPAPMPPVTPPPAAAPPAGAPASNPASGGGPMSFFTGKKPDAGAPAPAAQPAAPVAAPPPVAPAPEAPPAPAAPPAQPQGESGNPMSFFKGKKTDEAAS